MTDSPKLGSISDMLRATNHAGVTVCNRDRESGLPKCLPLPGDPRSNFHRLILLCHSGSNPVVIRFIKFNLTSRAYQTKSSPLEGLARPRALPRPPPYGAVERSARAWSPALQGNAGGPSPDTPVPSFSAPPWVGGTSRAYSGGS